ncbi:MAG: 5-(carboxyamino)imidazole ribonucleotide synthase [Leptolyngbyaceae cyanobacterium CSU_1_4]|nr:5-(carboxyamino)imidazole ribonucleotide synthase [Leptolyngbyaceae cyanobacterium CSU_1_4]
MTKRVGIIGGGQLAWMMANAVKKLGLELIVQTPQADDPAVAIATQTIFAAIDDAAATAQLVPLCDVITFENEFINLTALSPLAQQVPFYPSLSSLAPLLDKYNQRSYLERLHLPTPKFVALSEGADLSQLGFPVVLKARQHGYDGKGTFIAKTRSQLEQWLKELGRGSEQWLLEEFVPFDCELAVMAARSRTGEIMIYPVVETQQVEQVCRRVLVLPQEPALVEQVDAIARTLLNSLDFVGVMGIEFFRVDGKVWVNETAPRTHNSGHYSLDACVTSQFEQQLRAVSGMPLGDPALRGTGAVMVNLLGYESTEQEYRSQRQQLEQIPHAHVYWYGKSMARVGRKMGHVTVTLSSAEREEALAIAQNIESIWYQSV